MVATADKHDEIITRLAALSDQMAQVLLNHDERMRANEESIAETKRHVSQVQRLWVRLAKKHGWLDDEDSS